MQDDPFVPDHWEKHPDGSEALHRRLVKLVNRGDAFYLLADFSAAFSKNVSMVFRGTDCWLKTSIGTGVQITYIGDPKTAYTDPISPNEQRPQFIDSGIFAVILNRF